jgi:hypothetical protein
VCVKVGFLRLLWLASPGSGFGPGSVRCGPRLGWWPGSGAFRDGYRWGWGDRGRGMDWSSPTGRMASLHPPIQRLARCPPKCISSYQRLVALGVTVGRCRWTPKGRFQSDASLQQHRTWRETVTIRGMDSCRSIIYLSSEQTTLSNITQAANLNEKSGLALTCLVHDRIPEDSADRRRPDAIRRQTLSLLEDDDRGAARASLRSHSTAAFAGRGAAAVSAATSCDHSWPTRVMGQHAVSE